MSEIYTIKEFSSFTRGKKIDLENYICLPTHIFDNLEKFVLEYKLDNGLEALDIMSISVKKGIGKIIRAKNYVGIISLNDGTIIEILPKIYSHKENNNIYSKKILLNMLKSLKKYPFKSLQISSMEVKKLPLFEIFIRMFVDEVFHIVKRGLKCNYESFENNETFFKGKINFTKHIKHNIVHKEKSYIEYDRFNENRPENKLLKSTLKYLFLKSNSTKNKTDIKTLLSCFTEVEFSENYKSDFNKILIDRNLKEYKNVMIWCEVFLFGNSFTSFSGSKIATALLFPMDILFENYVASEINKRLDKEKFSISTQDREYHLFDSPDKKFLIKPDIVTRNKRNKDLFLFDTKWKVLTSEKNNYGISQSDMYQMYAYHKKYDSKYDSKHVTLLYPYTNKVSDTKKIEFSESDGAIVRVRFIDLLNIEKSIDELMRELV